MRPTVFTSIAQAQRTADKLRTTEQVARCALVAVCMVATLGFAILGPQIAQATATPSPDSVTTKINEAATFDVLVNDPSGSALVDYTDPAYGTLTVEGSHFSYLPDANFLGTDTFAYRAQLGETLFDPVSVTIEITGEVTSVEARDDDVTTDEDSPVLTYILGNDGLGPTAYALSAQITSEPSHGAAELQLDGSVLYTPAANWSGSDSYAYVASDGSTSDEATVTVDVSPVQDPPDAIDDAAFTAQENHASIEILANDTEADGDGYSLVEFTQPLYGAVTWSDRDHMMIYVPNPGFWGVDQFTYTIGDIDGVDSALVTIDVNGAPITQDDAATVERGGTVQIGVLGNDSDPEGAALIVANVGHPDHGTASINPDSTIQYSPSPEFLGQDSFTYTAKDEHGNGRDATVTVTVADRAAQSTGAVDDEFLVTEDSPGNTLDILSNDHIAIPGSVSISIDSTPAHGSVTLDALQLVTYVPNAEFSGQDNFSYSISDGVNPPSTAIVSIEVQAANDLPVAIPDAVIVDEDVEVTIDAISNDSDPDGDTLEIESVTAPANGVARVTTDGSITYLPTKDFAGVDSFGYVVADGSGDSATTTVTITVNPVNDTPDAVDDSHNLDIDGSALIDVLTNDHDPDGPQAFLSIRTMPEHGTASLTAFNTIQYLPEPGFEGYDTIEYEVSDGYASATATVLITVGDPNSAPRAKDDTPATTVEQSVVVEVLANDTDADGDKLVVYGVARPKHGTVTTDGVEITYVPDAGFVGTDSFTYKVRDNHGGRDRATVTVDVGQVKDRRADEK